MFKAPVAASFKRYVIVTQKKVREDTSHITNDAPKTWAYLTSHKEDFSKRKICFPTYDTAYTAMLILNSDRVQQFLLTIAFLDTKRPFTKKVLERIDFYKILRVISASDLVDTERKLGLQQYFNEKMFDAEKYSRQ